jgi:hypothetical protein
MLPQSCHFFQLYGFLRAAPGITQLITDTEVPQPVGEELLKKSAVVQVEPLKNLP